MANNDNATVDGWHIYFHPLFEQELLRLENQVALLNRKNSSSEKLRSYQKRLLQIIRITHELVPVRPGAPEHRLGDTLGKKYSGWFRVKFLQQYRLFYRFDSALKVIVFVWVNNEQTLRAYDSKSDAYGVFKKMLDSGYPPEDLKKLIAQSRKF